MAEPVIASDEDLKNDVDINFGKDFIRLVALQQSRSYERMKSGFPTSELNQEIICAFARKAKDMYRCPVYLVEPIETPIKYPGRYNLGNPAKIPQIACIGHWRSVGEVRENGRGNAELTVVWFQEDFAYPIAPDVLEEISELDWNQVSRWRNGF